MTRQATTASTLFVHFYTALQQLMSLRREENAMWKLAWQSIVLVNMDELTNYLKTEHTYNYVNICFIKIMYNCEFVVYNREFNFF